MTPQAEELEALHIRYGYKSMLVAKLSSGRFAIYTRGFNLVTIVDTWAELEAHYLPVEENKYVPRPTISSDDLNSILEDLL